jgi:transposase-like protein
MSSTVCKKCQSNNVVKSGHIRGFQRYKCKSCGCQFTKTAPRGKHPAIKSMAIVLYAFCGVSMGNIARIFKVSTVAVLKWIRQAASQIETPTKETAEAVILDEFWHFVNGKKTLVGCSEPLMGYRVRLSDTTWAIVVIETSKSL